MTDQEKLATLATQLGVNLDLPYKLRDSIKYAMLQIAHKNKDD